MSIRFLSCYAILVASFYNSDFTNKLVKRQENNSDALMVVKLEVTMNLGSVIKLLIVTPTLFYNPI